MKAFTFTGGEQTFTVPAGVHLISVNLVGGMGGDGGGVGGAAAVVSGDLEVTPGQVLYLEVGGNGEKQSEGGVGGFNGGGSAGGGAGLGCGGSGGEGAFGQGGNGGSGEAGTNGGGGGGGGYYGGGGGAGGCSLGGGGGGGGASLVPIDGESSIGVDTVPTIEIFYTPPPTIDIATPADGATYTLGQAVSASYSCAPHELASVAKCAGTVANGAAIDTSALGQHSFSVSAEDNRGGTSSKSVAYTVVASPPPPPPGVKAPNTVLGFHPQKKVKTRKKKVKVKFTFSSSSAGATFECKLDKGAFSPCTSPKTYKVKAGKHKFSVAAVNGGTADPTPAVFKFKVIHLG